MFYFCIYRRSKTLKIESKVEGEDEQTLGTIFFPTFVHGVCIEYICVMLWQKF